MTDLMEKQMEYIEKEISKYVDKFGTAVVKLVPITITVDTQYGEDIKRTPGTPISLRCFKFHPRETDSDYRLLVLNCGRDIRIDYKLVFSRKYLCSLNLADEREVKISVDDLILIPEEGREVEYKIVSIIDTGLVNGKNILVYLYVQRKITDNS